LLARPCFPRAGLNALPRFPETAFLKIGRRLTCAAVPRVSVDSYFEILVDTLLGHFLPAWQPGLKERAPPTSTIRWVGPASPVFDVSTTFVHFINFSIVNNGQATYGIKSTRGGRRLLFGMSFVPPVGASSFKDAAVWFDFFDYTFIDRCETSMAGCVSLSDS
jgi:hypothetical protein